MRPKVPNERQKSDEAESYACCQRREEGVCGRKFRGGDTLNHGLSLVGQLF
jgi:hypothetical protein